MGRQISFCFLNFFHCKVYFFSAFTTESVLLWFVYKLHFSVCSSEFFCPWKRALLAHFNLQLFLLTCETCLAASEEIAPNISTAETDWAMNHLSSSDGFLISQRMRSSKRKMQTENPKMDPLELEEIAKKQDWQNLEFIE